MRAPPRIFIHWMFIKLVLKWKMLQLNWARWVGSARCLSFLPESEWPTSAIDIHNTKHEIGTAKCELCWFGVQSLVNDAIARRLLANGIDIYMFTRCNSRCFGVPAIERVGAGADKDSTRRWSRHRPLCTLRRQNVIPTFSFWKTNVIRHTRCKQTHQANARRTMPPISKLLCGLKRIIPQCTDKREHFIILSLSINARSIRQRLASHCSANWSRVACNCCSMADDIRRVNASAFVCNARMHKR